MDTIELLNLMNIIKLRDKKNSLENGKVITCNNDSTYNVLITGTTGELYKISSVNKEIYSVGDNVLVGYPFESSNLPSILGRSPVEIPAEEDVVIKDVPVVEFIYLSRQGSKGISIYTIEGEYQEFIAGYLGNYFPQGMASSSDYIFKSSGYTISKFSKLSKTEITSWTGNLNNSRGICVSGNYIYVANYGAHNILKYDFFGNLITSWGSYGTGNGQFDNPWGICGDNYGSIYVTDRDNSRVQKFNSSGGFLNKFSVISSPYDIAIDNTGYIYISKSSAIYKYNSSGDLITSWSITDTWPFYMKFEEDILYVSGANSKKIYKYTTDGVLSDSWSIDHIAKGISM